MEKVDSIQKKYSNSGSFSKSISYVDLVKTINMAYYGNNEDNYKIFSNKDKLRLIDFFNKYPLQSPKKQRDFEIFSEVTKMIINKDHFTFVGESRIRQLKSLMHN